MDRDGSVAHTTLLPRCLVVRGIVERQETNKRAKLIMDNCNCYLKVEFILLSGGEDAPLDARHQHTAISKREIN